MKRNHSISGSPNELKIIPPLVPQNNTEGESQNCTLPTLITKVKKYEEDWNAALE